MISIAEFPNISCADGEYVPRVARAFFTLRMNQRDMISRAMMRRHIILVTVTKRMSTCASSGITCSHNSPVYPLSHSHKRTPFMSSTHFPLFRHISMR